PAVAHIYEPNDEYGFEYEQKKLMSLVGYLTPKHGREQQQGNQQEVLKYQYTQHRAPVIGGEFGPALKDLQHHRGAAQCSKKSKEQGTFPVDIITPRNE